MRKNQDLDSRLINGKPTRLQTYTVGGRHRFTILYNTQKKKKKLR